MITTRFAPSPTGRLHVGNLRTAVLNWLLTRRLGGQFILRIDDTDTERSREEHVDAIRRDLDWLGLHWDRYERQSARLGAYHDAADRLRGAGRLYQAWDTALELDLKRRQQLTAGQPPVYDRAALRLSEAERAARAGTPSHWRFLLEGRPVTWPDLIRGPERVEAASLSDPVLVREDGAVLYTLASVVDDAEMGVTHIVRGADHVTNTGTQIQIFAALGAAPPAFGHHSLLTGPGGEGLSKRLGAQSLGDLRAAGIEPRALVAMMARLGSSDPVEVVTDLDALVQAFDISHFGLAPTRFDPEELALLNAKTVHALPYPQVAARLAEMGVPDALAPAFWAAVGPNLAKVADAAAWWTLCRDGVAPIVAPEDADFVAQALALLPPAPWGPTTWGSWTAAVKAATGAKGRALFLPLRRALTGQDHGPDMAALMPLLPQGR